MGGVAVSFAAASILRPPGEAFFLIVAIIFAIVAAWHLTHLSRGPQNAATEI